ncbi:hypothetical protein HMI54_010821 [Coelomomyces lativittatus]|nr:hypothetical protein HMI54_010821 [Coelomomyces lativittatus]
MDRLKKDRDPFLGFFVLFWTFMTLNAIHTFVKNFQDHGTLVGLTTLPHLTSNFFHYLKIEIGMMISLVYALLWTRLVVFFHIPRYPWGYFLQHCFQFFFLIAWLTVAWQSQWSWIQTGVFTLHTINMYFKTHSFNEVNAQYWQLYLLHPTPFNHRFLDQLTLKNYIHYLSIPTLVYALEYPRTSSFRFSYFLKKIIGMVGIIFLLYITIEHYVAPMLHSMHKMTIWETLVELWFPFMTCYLLIFFLIFDCICNAVAEITRFADRNFYDDWWNSTSFDQFARKWNRPVHAFLRRHVYLESIQTHRLHKSSASYITFFYSSILHELVMVMISKRVLFYLFILQMTQIPLIWFSRTRWIQQNPILANAFFWFSMFSGPPLLAILYCRAVFLV